MVELEKKKKSKIKSYFTNLFNSFVPKIIVGGVVLLALMLLTIVIITLILPHIIGTLMVVGGLFVALVVGHYILGGDKE